MRRSLKADLALLGVTFIWGASFPLVKSALQDASPVLFLFLRFALAAGLSAPLWPGLWRRRLKAAELGVGLLLGGVLALAFAGQTLGLQSLDPTRSAFITALYVGFVPLLSIPLLRRLPRFMSVAGSFCSLGGLVLLTWKGAGLGLATGEWLTLGCAVGFALHIIGVGAFTARYDFRRLYLLQVMSATLFLGLLLPAESVHLVLSLRLAGALLVTGGLCTALAFYVQNRVQQRTTPTRTAIVFSMEPVFAALCAVVFLPSPTAVTFQKVAGAVLIVAGVILAEIRLPARGPARESADLSRPGERRRMARSP